MVPGLSEEAVLSPRDPGKSLRLAIGKSDSDDSVVVKVSGLAMSCSLKVRIIHGSDPNSLGMKGVKGRRLTLSPQEIANT